MEFNGNCNNRLGADTHNLSFIQTSLKINHYTPIKQ